MSDEGKPAPPDVSGNTLTESCIIGLVDLLTPEILPASWLATPKGEVANEGDRVLPEKINYFPCSIIIPMNSRHLTFIVLGLLLLLSGILYGSYLTKSRYSKVLSGNIVVEPTITLSPTLTITPTPTPLPIPTERVVYIEKENEDLTEINETLKRQNELKEAEIKMQVIDNIYDSFDKLRDKY